MAITAITVIKVSSLISCNFISLQRKLACQDWIGIKIRLIIWCWYDNEMIPISENEIIKTKFGNYGSNVFGYDMQAYDTSRFLDKDIAGEDCVCIKVLDYEVCLKLSNGKMCFLCTSCQCNGCCRQKLWQSLAQMHIMTSTPLKGRH